MPDPDRDTPILTQLLAHVNVFPALRRESPLETAQRWLDETESGGELCSYLRDEAGMLDSAADHLNATGNEALREIARELGNAASRLRRLVE